MACPLGYPFSEYQTGGALHVTMMISRSGPLHQSRLLSQAMKALSGKGFDVSWSFGSPSAGVSPNGCDTLYKMMLYVPHE